MNGNAESLIRTAAKEIGEYGSNPIVTAELGAAATIELIGMLQLVTRHPELPERALGLARELVGNFSRAFKPEHRAIQELIKRGWAAEHDVEVKA
jgi:hypothetical protein